MALPGLGEDDVPVLQEQEPVEHELAANREWRFEVAFTETVEVKLVSGTAELFGTELAPQHTYTFRGTKAAIYTHHGCTLSSLGVLQSDYIAEETPMTQYVNLHFALEALRTSADSSGGSGPRVLVLGPPNAGKTSLCKLLSAYALRSGASSVLGANLDPKEGMVTVPGTLSAVALESILDVEAEGGWGSAPTNGPMPVPVKLPLVYYYGCDDAEHDVEAYKALVSRLALSVTGRLSEDASLRRTGLIIDAPGSMGTGRAGVGLVEHVVAEFGVDVIAVLGSEKLYSDVSKRLARPGATHVVKVDRSGGTVHRDAAYTARARQEQVHEYFYGDARVTLNPHSTFVDWADVAVFRLADGDSDGATSASFLPGGALPDATSPPQPLRRVDEPESELHNAVLAVMNADPGAPLSDIRAANVLGFVHVAEIDDKRKRLKLLAPLSGRLPRRTLLWGLWPEQIELDATTVTR